MRRIWLSLLLAVSLALGATADAWASQDCPYKAAPAAHDCCPDGDAMTGGSAMGGDQPAHPEKPVKDCRIGQACRANPAVAPSLQAVSVVVEMTVSQPVDRHQAGAPAAPTSAFWRPPRTV